MKTLPWAICVLGLLTELAPARHTPTSSFPMASNNMNASPVRNLAVGDSTNGLAGAKRQKGARNTASQTNSPAVQGELKNLSFEIDSTTPRRVSLEVTGPGIASPLRYDFRAGRGVNGAGIHVPPGKDREIKILVVGEDGKPTHLGLVKLQVTKEPIRSVYVKLLPLQKPEPLTAVLGTYRLEVQQVTGKQEASPTYRVEVLDPSGKAIDFSEDDITLRSSQFLTTPPAHVGQRPHLVPHLTVTTAAGAAPFFTCFQTGACQLISPVVAPSQYRSVTSGQDFSCALDMNGAAWCWGNDFTGELGFSNSHMTLCVATFPCSPSPAPVAGGHTFALIGAGFDFACGIDNLRQIWCWGDDAFGSLGSTSEPVPPSLVGGAPFAAAHQFNALSVGQFHACGITLDRLLFCWGSNTHGQLGIGSSNPAGPPTQVNNGLSWSAVAAGTLHTCATTTDLKMYCWGDAESGALSIDPTVTKTQNCTFGSATFQCMQSPTTPVPATNGASGYWDLVTAGSGFTCARDSLGSHFTYCWGASGFTGTGSVAPGPTPTPIVSTAVFSGIQAGNGYACAIPNAPGDTVCWGVAPFVGIPWTANNPVINFPMPISGFQFAQMAPGGDHLCALDTAGGVLCWGLGVDGQLGNGETTSSTTPVQVK